ncbi:MAG: hypothetical protein ABGY05_12815, partial [Pseudomonadota bacterium]
KRGGKLRLQLRQGLRPVGRGDWVHAPIVDRGGPGSVRLGLITRSLLVRCTKHVLLKISCNNIT